MLVRLQIVYKRVRRSCRDESRIATLGAMNNTLHPNLLNARFNMRIRTDNQVCIQKPSAGIEEIYCLAHGSEFFLSRKMMKRIRAVHEIATFAAQQFRELPKI